MVHWKGLVMLPWFDAATAAAADYDQIEMLHHPPDFLIDGGHRYGLEFWLIQSQHRVFLHSNLL